MVQVFAGARICLSKDARGRRASRARPSWCAIRPAAKIFRAQVTGKDQVSRAMKDSDSMKRIHSCVTTVRCHGVLCGQDSNRQEESRRKPSRRRWTNTSRKPRSRRRPTARSPQNGSLWSPAARFSDLASDLRARRVDDIVTIVVQESASAVSTGNRKTSRASSAQSQHHRPGGQAQPGADRWRIWRIWARPLRSTEQGTTSRQTTLTTTVSARVTHVLVNGNLVVEGTKNVNINSENQMITVRGVIRPIDLDTTNSVQSARLAQMEIQVERQGNRERRDAPAEYPLSVAAWAVAVSRRCADVHPLVHFAVCWLLPCRWSSRVAGSAGTRLKELVSLEGVRDNQLIGYGLVVGLAGTGDRQLTLFSAQSLDEHAAADGRIGSRHRRFWSRTPRL